MNVSTMRRIDWWVGIPLTLALTQVRRAIERSKDGQRQGPQRIVFIKLAEQGSTVLASSAIRRAAELVGRNNVYFALFEENRFILDVMELIPAENVLTIRNHNVFALLQDSFGVCRKLRGLGVDTAIDLEFFARSSAILTFLSGASRRVGFHTYGEGPYRGDLMTHPLIFNPHIHTSQTFRMMVDALTVTNPKNFPAFDLLPARADDPPPSFEPGHGEVEEARSLLEEAAGSEDFRPLILLNPNCGDLLQLRRWPTERYVELARRLLERYPSAHVAMTGGPLEGPYVGELVAQVGSERCFNLAGRTTLRQLLVIYGLAEVLVTNDSGPAHFAALTAIDVVTLFGPETPHLFAARTPRNHTIWAGLGCSPCVSALNGRTSSCQNNLCMQRIDLERVFATVCELLDSRCGAQCP